MLTTTVQGRTWNFSHAIGRNAAAGNGFTQPMSIACDKSNGIVVLSRGGEGAGGVAQPNKRIGKVTINEEFMGDFGHGDFTWPAALAVDSKNHVYCTDEHENRVVAYDQDGKKIGEWGHFGNEEGQLSMPSGITFDENDNLYIVDSGNNHTEVHFQRRFYTFLGFQGFKCRSIRRPLGYYNGHLWVSVYSRLGK